MAVRQRVFIVQRADQETGRPIGEPIAAKLTRGAAQAVAKREAPCRITALWADKSETNSSPRAAEWGTENGEASKEPSRPHHVEGRNRH